MTLKVCNVLQTSWKSLKARISPGITSSTTCTPEEASYLRGLRYNAEKKVQGAPEGNKNAAKQKGQSDPIETTAQRLADDYKVSEKTIKRDGKFAVQVDAIARRCGVGHPFVGKIRKEVSLATDTSERTYTTKHGTTATMQTSNIGRKEEAESSPPQDMEPEEGKGSRGGYGNQLMADIAVCIS